MLHKNGTKGMWRLISLRKCKSINKRFFHIYHLHKGYFNFFASLVLLLSLCRPNCLARGPPIGNAQAWTCAYPALLNGGCALPLHQLLVWQFSAFIAVSRTPKNHVCTPFLLYTMDPRTSHTLLLPPMYWHLNQFGAHPTVIDCWFYWSSMPVCLLGI